MLEPSKWLTDANSETKIRQFQFEKDVMLPSNTVSIAGKLTEDLDLTFTEEDVEHLFSYELKDYSKICKLALDSFNAGDDQE